MKELIYKGSKGFDDIDESQGIIKGMGSVFGNVDSDGDIMEKGAFTKTLQESSHKGRIKYLYQHRLDQPIGVFKEINETTKGLEFVAQIALKTKLGEDVFEMMKAGLLTENSVGFKTIKQEYDKKSKLNYIKEVKLYEISAVTLAANPLAFINEVKEEGVDKKELLNKHLEERFEALNKLVKSNISDELGLAVEFEIKSLKELALRDIITEPIVKEHSAEDLAEINMREQLNTISNFIKNL